MPTLSAIAARFGEVNRQTLNDEEERRRRLLHIRDPHIAPLNALIDEVRAGEGDHAIVPYIDPLYGGIEASIVVVGIAPGPKAVTTGFVSADNPDASARNFRGVLEEAGMQRSDVVFWNICPRQLTNENGSVRKPTKDELDEGFGWFDRAIQQCVRVQHVIAMGQPPARALRQWSNPRKLQVSQTWHTSPQCVNPAPERIDQIIDHFRRCATVF